MPRGRRRPRRFWLFPVAPLAGPGAGARGGRHRRRLHVARDADTVRALVARGSDVNALTTSKERAALRGAV